MDTSSRSSTIGIILIIGLFFGWLYMSQPTRVPTTLKRDTSSTALGRTDSLRTADTSATTIQPADTTAQADRSIFAPKSSVAAVSKRIETPLFTAEVSSTGAALRHFVLKNYKTWDKKPLDLVNQQNYQGGDVNLRFVASDGKVASTKDLPFELDQTPVTLSETDSVTFTAVYRLDSGKFVQKTYTFRGDGYMMGIRYTLTGLQEAIAGYHYNAVVENNLPYAEEHSTTEATAAIAFAGIADEVEEIDASDPSEPVKRALNGEVKYVGARTRYFIEALIADQPKSSGADLSGLAKPSKDGGVIENYTVSLTVPVMDQPIDDLQFKYYLGPLEYYRIRDLNLGIEEAMDFGWSFIVRPISVYLLLPLFMWLHNFISNWGLVIVVFSILIKILTLPLTNKQMHSMRKMQVLNPKVMEVREKYKDDPQKMNQEMLNLYRTYGVNPAGGCFPLLLQMPILFALYSVLSNVIELRQAPFMWWINDLSSPDVLFKFGTSIPLLGEHLSGLTLLLTATTFLQQMWTVTDPRQKSMMYIMSLVFVFMFNSLPSGVALYYFVFNIIGLFQQFYLTKIATPLDIEKMKVDPKKGGGGLMARLQDMEKKTREQRQQQYAGKTPGKNKGGKGKGR